MRSPRQSLWSDALISKAGNLMGKGETGIWWVDIRDDAKHPTTPRSATTIPLPGPIAKNQLAPNVNSTLL